MIRKFGTWLFKTSNRYIFAALVVLVCALGWVGLNEAMDRTNTLEFCISCHEMEANVYREYQTTAHYKNRVGVRVGCPDCHVPKQWIAKFWRKLQASNEVYHWLAGSIDTRQKFQDKRLELARHVWADMKANNSRECKACHSFDAMHWDVQSNRARRFMKQAAETDMACIECHKGIAHRLPKLGLTYKKIRHDILSLAAHDPLSQGSATTLEQVKAYANPDDTQEKIFVIDPLSDVKILEKQGDWIKVSTPAEATGEENIGWIKREPLVSNRKQALGYADELWRTDCNMCHNLRPADDFTPQEWVKRIEAMRRYTSLSDDMLLVVQKYMQIKASDNEKN